MLDIINLDELEARARELLSPMAFDYIAGGAADEWTLHENRAAFKRLRLVPRMLTGTRERQTTTTVLGTHVALPVLVAPTAMHGLVHPDGELATARGAAAADTIMIASSISNYSLEAIARARGGACWFQLYVYRDRALTRALVERAQAAGYSALCVTVDAPLIGRRERDVRNRFTLPAGLTLANFEGTTAADIPAADSDSGMTSYVATQWDDALSWRDIEWLRSLTSLPLVLKGIMSPADAALAAEHGAAAVIVSNHGGRQLDTVPAAITVLPRIVEAVDGRLEVLLDGGIRRGTDVLKALALGARAVLLGRTILWALALDGASGVESALGHLQQEIALALALLGCSSVAELSDSFLWHEPTS